MRLALALAATAATLLPTLAHADAWSPVDQVASVAEGPVAVDVTVNGRGTPLYQRADRTDRWYLEAREGAHYEVRVRNLTGERVGFVLAVDGLNAINGTESHLGADEPMYVLDPYAQTTVKGWRKSLSNVSKFVFVDEARSYAARTDQANGDLGWIRVVAFNEVRPVAWGGTWGARKSPYRDGGRTEAAPSPSTAPGRENSLRKDAAAQDAAPLAERSLTPAPSSPGTGWGGNQHDPVREVSFRPEPYAAAQVILRYEYRDALARLGVLPAYDWRRDRLREREEGRLGFAQPPKW